MTHPSVLNRPQRMAICSLGLQPMTQRLHEGRVTQEDYRWYTFFWHWSCLRFTSERQERVFARRGWTALERRVARVRRHWQRLREEARTLLQEQDYAHPARRRLQVQRGELVRHGQHVQRLSAQARAHGQHRLGPHGSPGKLLP